LHFTIGDDLAHLISKQELENVKLKRRISELEDALNLKPLFAEPLAIVAPDQNPPSTHGTLVRVRKETNLLSGVRFMLCIILMKVSISFHRNRRSSPT